MKYNSTYYFSMNTTHSTCLEEIKKMPYDAGIPLARICDNKLSPTDIKSSLSKSSWCTEWMERRNIYNNNL